MTFKKASWISGLALAAFGAIAAPVSAETLRFAWAQDATGIDPHKQTAFPSLRLMELVYEPLVRLDADLNIVGAVAESWEFSDDSKTLTFKLNPNAKFSDGTSVTSADVKATFERILDEATGAAARANFASIETIDTPDDTTVVFNLSLADVPLLTALSSANASIVPAAAIADGSLGTTVVGSGPFTLTSWEPNSRASLGVNEFWAGGDVAYDGIEISVLPDESAILASLRSGQTDFALLNDPLIATLVPSVSGVTLNRTPQLAYHVLQLNASHAPFDNLAVRQAISCAIDRQDVLDTAMIGEGTVTGPLTMPAYATDPANLFCYQQDLDKARELMAEAGFQNGFEATVVVATGEPPTAASEAQVIQAQLAEIGIKLDIKMMELSVYVDTWLKGDFDMAVALNGGQPDPFTMYNRYWTKAGNLQHVAGYIDDTLDELMLEGRAESDLAKRREIFAAFEAHLAETSPWVWLYTAYAYSALRDNVTGFVPTPQGSLFSLANVTIN
ncbi:ABC transporter substrate-binding protein [Ketogulonicigenium robustum]|uniref:ABC transporter substrate-binding protein n=1 Tax=Ketogulonicigenium robustum TaxID=92947 RepID=A0A1W6NXS1_9RHOB|nr:ABC transporter substrate-binding protein [Ketogulonicigenium robustum]ARO13890.1 ABC transporter substrate-binding protein [Ketogulonicigenium robustum]